MLLILSLVAVVILGVHCTYYMHICGTYTTYQYCSYTTLVNIQYHISLYYLLAHYSHGPVKYIFIHCTSDNGPGPTTTINVK